jgi:cell wall-associated NlpC family hydrolase
MYSTLDNEAIAEKAIAEAGHSLGTGWSKVSKDILQLGDIVTFRIMGHETHCGIMIDKYQFLHTLKGRQSCIEELSHINWVHRHTGSFRWKNKN